MTVANWICFVDAIIFGLGAILAYRADDNEVLVLVLPLFILSAVGWLS